MSDYWSGKIIRAILLGLLGLGDCILQKHNIEIERKKSNGMKSSR